MHAAGEIALRHFLMHDAGSGRHPLHVARAERALIAEAVAMLDGAGEHIGDRLDAAMRMPREAAQIVLRTIITEIIHHQKGIGQARITKAEHALQLYARTFKVRRGAGNLPDRTDGHGSLQCSRGGRTRRPASLGREHRITTACR